MLWFSVFFFLFFFDQSNLSLAVEMYFQWTHFDSGSCLRGLPVLQLSAQFISWTNCCLSPAAWQTFKTLKRGLEEDMLRWAALSKNHFQGRRNVYRSNRNIIVPLKKENCLSLSPLGEHDFTRFFLWFWRITPFYFLPCSQGTDTKQSVAICYYENRSMTCSSDLTIPGMKKAQLHH